MKFLILKVSFSLGCTGAILATAFITNSPSKAEHARIIVEHAHTQWCTDPGSEVCEFLSPLTRPALQSAIYFYTTTHNRGLFTTYQTRLPCLDIYGISVFGQHLIWPAFDRYSSTCQPLATWPNKVLQTTRLMLSCHGGSCGYDAQF